MNLITRASKQSDAERLAQMESWLASCTTEQIAFAADCAFSRNKFPYINALKPLSDEYSELHMRLNKDEVK